MTWSRVGDTAVTKQGSRPRGAYVPTGETSSNSLKHRPSTLKFIIFLNLISILAESWDNSIFVILI